MAATLTKMMLLHQVRRHCCPVARPAAALALALAPLRRCAASSSSSSDSAASVLVKVPHMADSISEGTLKSLSKNVGDYVSADEELASIETDKIDVAVNSPVSGIVRKYFAKIEDTVVVGADLCEIEKKDVPPTTSQDVKKPTTQVQENTQQDAVEKKTTPMTPSKPAPAVEQPKQAPAAIALGSGETRVKMSPMRIRIAERLKESQNTAAALTTFNEVDMTELIKFRNAVKEDVLKTHGVKLGFMSAFVKAACYAATHVPVVMARIDSGGTEIVYPGSVDVSVAVATKKGLLTPVLRGAEKLSFLGVERELASMAARARDGKITMADLSGGNFTISNGGVFGSLMGTPIINLPQSAILGMHATKERAVVVDGAVVVRPMMYICLTYDHRLIDGREAVTFLVKVKEAIERPSVMLL